MRRVGRLVAWLAEMESEQDRRGKDATLVLIYVDSGVRCFAGDSPLTLNFRLQISEFFLSIDFLGIFTCVFWRRDEGFWHQMIF